MKGIVAFLSGVGAAVGLAWVFEARRTRHEITKNPTKGTGPRAYSAVSITEIDLNECGREDLVGLGLSEDLADRVLGNRPYRNKLDLMSRLIIPEAAYDMIKHSIGVDEGSASEPVKVAS